jgi:hypothetical protein
MAKTCPGCIGRGTGTHCCMCSNPIPESLQRKNGQPAYPGDAYDSGCPDCVRGAFHTHR